jgi:tetratricopeptide (TPR) repeat protein
VLVALAALAPYAALPSKPLYPDAVRSVTVHEPVRSGSLAGILSSDFWGAPMASPASTGSYRPAVSLTYAAQLHVFGEGPASFHVFDLLLHAATAVLVALLIATFVPGTRWAVPCAALYAVHPVLSEAVASVVGRADLMAAACLVGALLLHLGARSSRERERRFEIGAAALLGVALFSKEYAIAFPFVVAGADLALHACGRRSRDDLRRARSLWIAGILLAVLYVAVRSALSGHLGGVTVAGSSGDSPLVGLPWIARPATALWLFVPAARLLLVPIDLNHMYGFGTLSIARGVLDPRALAGAALVLGSLGAALFAIRRLREPVPMIAWLLFVPPLVPALNTIGLVAVLFAERFLVLAAVAFALLAAWAAERYLPLSRWSIAGVLVLAALLGGATARRIEDWTSLETLARSAIRAYPDSASAWYELGVALGTQGRHAEAVDALTRSVEINDQSPQHWKDLGVAFFHVGRFEESAGAWRKALALSPQNLAPLWRGLGQASLLAGKLDEAIEALARASDLGDAGAAPELADALLSRGIALVKAKDASGARSSFDRAQTLDPDVVRRRFDRATALDAQGRHAEAADTFRDIHIVLPDSAPVLFNLGRSLFLAGRPAEAIPSLEAGLAIQEDAEARRLLEECRRSARRP